MKNKVFVGLVAVVLIGIIIVAVLGFNVDMCYKSYNLIQIEIGQDFNIKDIKNITNEVFKKQHVEIQKTGDYSDNLIIKVDAKNEVTEEQKNSLNTKINEKFGLNNSVENLEVRYIPNYRLWDIVKNYLMPIGIAGLVILIYMAFRFRKIGVAKVIFQTIILSAIAELLYFSLIAITRYPINELVMPVAIVIFIIIITILTGMFEKQKSIENK